MLSDIANHETSLIRPPCDDNRQISGTDPDQPTAWIWRTTNIGHPKLFIGGAVGRQVAPAAPAVNNFAANRDLGSLSGRMADIR
jgi:hypothetical protein